MSKDVDKTQRSRSREEVEEPAGHLGAQGDHQQRALMRRLKNRRAKPQVVVSDDPDRDIEERASKTDQSDLPEQLRGGESGFESPEVYQRAETDPTSFAIEVMAEGDKRRMEVAKAIQKWQRMLLGEQIAPTLAGAISFSSVQARFVDLLLGQVVGVATGIVREGTEIAVGGPVGAFAGATLRADEAARTAGSKLGAVDVVITKLTAALDHARAESAQQVKAALGDPVRLANLLIAMTKTPIDQETTVSLIDAYYREAARHSGGLTVNQQLDMERDRRAGLGAGLDAAQAGADAARGD